LGLDESIWLTHGFATSHSRVGSEQLLVGEYWSTLCRKPIIRAIRVPVRQGALNPTAGDVFGGKGSQRRKQ
jgi:hypothetical protein